MKTPSPDLYYLVKSLNQTEKRDFTRFSTMYSRKEEKAYTKLFNEILAQDEFDELNLRKSFKSHPANRQFHVLKNYLYKSILRSLRWKNERNSLETRLRNELEEAALLQKRGLQIPAKKLLLKVRKQAEKFEKYDILIGALNSLIDILIFEKKRNLVSEMTALRKDIIQASEKFVEAKRLRVLRAEIFSQRMMKTIRGEKKDQSAILQYLKEPDLSKKFMPLSFEGKINKEQCLAYIFATTEHYQDAFVHYEQAVNIWEKHPHFIKENPKAYKIDLLNYMQFCSKLQYNNKFEEQLIKARKLPALSESETIQDIQNLLYVEFYHTVQTCQFESAKRLVPEIQKKLEDYRDKLRPARIAAFHFNIGALYFILEEYESVYFWLYPIVQSEKTDIRKQLKKWSGVLTLIAYLEIENDRLFDSFYRSFNRKLDSADDIDKVIKIFIQGLKPLMNPPSSASVDQFYISLNHQLNEAILKLFPNGEPRDFEYIRLWLNAKLEGISIAQISRNQKQEEIAQV